jgi:hypothetical protein
MLGHWQTLIRGIVEQPEARIDELPLLSAEEEKQLVVERNRTEVVWGEQRWVHEQFEEQAELRRDEVGLDFEGRELSYGELNVRANQLAHYLRKMGVGPEVPVGICMQRSVEMVVGLLGIMKAGGAYVPLDPDYPAERLAFMAQASGTGGAGGARGGGDRAPEQGQPGGGVKRGKPGVCDLYLRLDGAAQRSDEHACGAAEPAAVDAGGIPVERGGSSATEDAVQL